LAWGQENPLHPDTNFGINRNNNLRVSEAASPFDFILQKTFSKIGAGASNRKRSVDVFNIKLTFFLTFFHGLIIA